MAIFISLEMQSQIFETILLICSLPAYMTVEDFEKIVTIKIQYTYEQEGW